MDIQLKPLPEERRANQNAQYSQQPPPPPPPRYGRTFVQSCLVAGCATILAPVVLFALCIALLAAMMPDDMDNASGAFGSLYQSPLSGNLREKILRQGGKGAGAIALVSIHGVIDGGGSPLEGTGKLAFVSDQLRAAALDDSVKAVVLQIDSPGGGLTASDLLYNEVRELRAKGKKVIAWAGGMMTSGGYYVALAAEGIMANPTTTLGSIGVMMSRFQVSDLMKLVGVKSDPITSGEHKDIGSPYRDMTPEERKHLQGFIDESHALFVELVAKNRDMPREEAAALADGNIYTAETAMNLGMIDRIGYIEDALSWAEELAGEEDMRVVSYRRLLSLSEILFETSRAAARAAVETASGDPAPRAMAVWNGK